MRVLYPLHIYLSLPVTQELKTLWTSSPQPMPPLRAVPPLFLHCLKKKEPNTPAAARVSQCYPASNAQGASSFTINHARININIC